MPDNLTELSALWGGFKQDFGTLLGLTPDALHVHVGVALMVVCTMILRTSYRNWRPWGIVLFIECVNEALDLMQPTGSVESNWPASQHDIINTMVAPTLILLGAAIASRSQHNRQ